MIVIFFMAALVIVASGIGVVAARNPIHSALFLIANLLSVAGIFAMLGAHFLATVQIIVYAGAIMVLVIFVLMLLNLKVERLKRAEIVTTVFAVVVGSFFLAALIPLFNEAFRFFPEPKVALEGSVRNMGELLYSRYVFPFEAASILITAAIAGAVMLAKRRYKEVR